MTFLGKYLVGFTLPFSLFLLSMLGLLLMLVIARRRGRRLHFRHLDAARDACRPILNELLAGSSDYEEGLARLRQAANGLHHSLLERLLITERNPSPERAGILRRLCEDLGLVSVWQSRLAGRAGETGGPRPSLLERVGPLSFVARAEAAANLGIVGHQPSWRLLVEALDDAHLDVRSVAARALGRIREPASFPLLAARIERVALDAVPGLSARVLKTALASFFLSQAASLRSQLEHPHPRVRFLAADVISAAVEGEAAQDPAQELDPGRFPPELAEIFLTRLSEDASPDVRARAADVVGRVEDVRGLPVLLRLLEDREWFVRLHAVRALRFQRRLVPLGPLSRRLTDPHWRVREAAAQALCASGRPGIDRLLDHFLHTADRYSREQAAEEIDRAGLLPSFLEALSDPGRQSEARFIREIVCLGKGGMLLAALRDGSAPRAREALRRALTRDPDPRVHSFVRQLASASSEVEGFV